jgi:serine/threonine-protein kinase
MVLRDGTLKLTDFGIARDLDETRLTATHSTVGTAAYMSPEQCRGDPNITHKSDLYSLGVVFYELVTGRKPFQAESVLEMFQQHVSGTFERPSRIILDIPVWLDTLICQLLEKSPDKRPRDAGVVGESLNRIMEKVTAQQSAAEETAKARLIDRPRGAPRPDEQDREAARSIRGGKKRGKPKAVPWHSRVWVRALGILVALAGVGGLLALALRPPSADRLYAQARSLMESNDPDQQYEARLGPIVRFLEYYPDHAKASQVREWADQVDLAGREQRLSRLLRSHKGASPIRTDPENAGEQLALDATLAEEAGDLTASQRTWQELNDQYQKGAVQRSWGLMAERRLGDLKEAAAREERLLNRIRLDEKGEFANDYKPEDEMERQAAEAIRNEALQKFTTAREGWEKLRKAAQAKAGSQRPWGLLAARKVRELTEAIEKRPEPATTPGEPKPN